MINRVILTGRLTKDPEMSMTPNGIARTHFTLAVNRAFKNQNGEQEADFVNIQVWRKQAENAANYLKKGSLVGIDGRIQTGSYEKDGQRVYFTNVVADSVQFLESRNVQNSQNSTSNYQSNTNYQQSNQTQYNANTGQSQPFGNSEQFNQQRDPFANNNGPVVDDSDLPF